MGQAQSTPTFPQPGDHIYCRRKGGLYDHHGIYVGDNMVIHLRGAAKKLGEPPPCSKCGNKRVINGEIAKVCIDCFLQGQELKIYKYGVPFAELALSIIGTCSTHHSKPPHEVIKTANDFLEHSGFGSYDLFANNCEHFAMYCKTGTAASNQISGNIALLGNASCPVGAIAGLSAFGVSKLLTDAQRRR